ncbi:MAG: hypothetical protein ABSB42_03705 [Tepidisphaeraceae bacterium]|jgi:hypothetical protein
MRSLSAPCKQTIGQVLRLTLGFSTTLAFFLVLSMPNLAAADAPTSKPASAPEKAYWIDYFSPIFQTRAGQATADAAFQANLNAIIGNTDVELGQTNTGYVAASPDISTAHRRIAELNLEGSTEYSQGAILAIDKAIVRELNKQGYGAVLAVPSPSDIDPQDLADLRPRHKGTLHLLVSVPTAAQVRTVASGDRIPSSQPRVNNSKQARIIHNSPVQATTRPTANATPFFDEKRVNDYVDRLNRQPGRRVDVAISAADQPDQYTLDYLVNEIKPWYVYAQASNTGTALTNTWRERFGLVDNQLSGNDDILNIDAVTDFDQSTDATASYEFPIGADVPWLGTDRLRARVYGIWDQYTASDLGLAGSSFTGTDYSGGGELIYNFFQNHNMFWDVIGGARYQSSTVKSTFEQTNATGEYILPYAGVRVQDYRDTYYYVVAVNVEGGITTTNKAVLAELGRADPDSDWVLLQPNAQGSFFLEPLIDPSDFGAGRGTLAHEIYLSARGQWAFNSRLIPQFEQAAGGFYSVRGYPEAELAGDTVFFGTAEYRFHLSRFLSVAPNPSNFKLFGEPFRLTPEQPYQRPDWDLILRAFVDAGQVLQSRKVAGEFDNTLASAGAGAELQVRQNIDLRGDWGLVLSGLGTRVKVGSSRFTLIVTLLY